MKSTRRAFVLLVAAALAFAVLAGCEPPKEDDNGTWVYDFMTDGDALEDSGTDWYVDAGNMGETGNGYWLNQASVAAPYLFTGDFVAEFEFYLKVIDVDYIYRYAFRLIGPEWAGPLSSSSRYFSFSATYTASPPDDDRYYEIAQGNGDYSDQSFYQTVPDISLNDINTCRLVRAGNVITTSMNGTFIDTETIDPLNEPSVGYAPLIHGHGSTDVAESNFFIRKLTVTYVPGERVDHDWNP
jgi:hypothetical protein